MKTIEKTKTGPQDKPVDDVKIKDCGTLLVEEPFVVDK